MSLYTRTQRLVWAVTSHCPQITRSYTAENKIGTWAEGVILWLTFVTFSRVASLNGLLFIGKLDWEWVKKLGGKFVQLRLEDSVAREYQGT